MIKNKFKEKQIFQNLKEFKKEKLKKYLIDFIHESKKTLIIISILFIIIIVLFSFVFENRTTTMIISLNYKEASDGLNPNGSRFNIFDLKSEEVLERTLELAGEKNNYSIDKLYNSISIIQNGQSTNIPTTYTIKYTKDFKLKNISSKQMTKFLFKSYKEYFKENYSNNNSVLNYDIKNFDNDEYLYIIKSLELTATNMSNYLNDKLKENTTFKDENNYTFEDLKESVDNVLNINIANLKAYVNENGIAKDNISLKNLLTYKNELLDVDYQTNILGYETRKEGIGLYDSQMSSIVLIPSIDENNDYYMSKTKIGIDYLATDSNNYLKESEWFKSEITKNNDIILKLNKNNTTETKDKTDSMIYSIQQALKDISNKAKKLDQEYIEYKNKNYISCSIKDNHFSVKLFILIFIISNILSFIINILYYIFKKEKNT